MAKSHVALPALALRQGQDIRASGCSVFFPLTPALSLGERANHSLRGEQSRALVFPLRDARCSLSLRERDRVRGNDAAYHPAYRTHSALLAEGQIRSFLSALCLRQNR